MKKLMWSFFLIVLFCIDVKAYENAERIKNHSAGPKVILFIPNNDEPGLKGYSNGIGIGGDARFGVVNQEKFNLLIGPELGYIGGVSKDVSGYINSTLYNVKYVLSIFKIKGNLIFAFPVGIVVFNIGGGIVYQSGVGDVTVTSPGQYGSMSGTAEWSGVGGQILGGIDIKTGRIGAVTLEGTYPLSQSYTYTFRMVGYSYSYPAMNFGGLEGFIGYRFYF